MGFPGGASGREPICQCRRHKRPGFGPWVGKIPWRRAWQPPPVFLPGETPWTRGAYWAMVHRFAKSWTQLKQLRACVLNIHLWYDPAILLLGIYPKEIKACVHAKTCVWIFTATSIVTAQTKHNQMFINTLWLDKQMWCLYIYHRILLSHKKEQWLNLRITILSLISNN